MSTIPTSPPPEAVPVVPVVPLEPRQVIIFSHSNLFYWWPVWAVGFIMAVVTLIDSHRMVVVPSGTKAVRGDGHDELVLPDKARLPTDENGEPKPRMLHISNRRSLGVVWATVLLLTIVVSNVPLRGLWSLVAVLFIVLLVVIFALAGWWESIIEYFGLLDIRVNAGGYLFISTVLAIIWALTVFVFDHRTYVVVTPGQVRVCMAVGAGETVYDTTGMTFQKHQNDLFRHWIIGLGSGDLIVHRSNTNQEIDMPNVLFIGQKVKEIEQLIKERPVVA